MKLLTQKQIEEHNAASIRGATEGTVGSGVFAIGTSWFLNRRWPYYRSLPLSLKALGVVIVVAPCLAIQAERRGLEYDKSQWTGVGKMALEEEEEQGKEKWESLSMGQKFKDWMARHEYGIILGSWALSMAVAWSIIMRDRYQTLPQKVVQVRMWAQGLTIGVLIAAGALTHSKRAEAAKLRTIDHSWALVLEQQEREREALKVAAQIPKSFSQPSV